MVSGFHKQIQNDFSRSIFVSSCNRKLSIYKISVSHEQIQHAISSYLFWVAEITNWAFIYFKFFMERFKVSYQVTFLLQPQIELKRLQNRKRSMLGVWKKFCCSAWSAPHADALVQFLDFFSNLKLWPQAFLLPLELWWCIVASLKAQRSIHLHCTC